MLAPIDIDFSEHAEDPIDKLKSLPERDDELLNVYQQLTRHSVHAVVAFIENLGPGDRALDCQVIYSQQLHMKLQMALGYVLGQARMIGALGRDRRNALEAKLLARIEALEARPVLRYAGTWNPDTQFNEGDITTDHGSAWYCERSTRSRPPGKDWVLMVKKGRDARNNDDPKRS